jgi:hypothetical protein
MSRGGRFTLIGAVALLLGAQAPPPLQPAAPDPAQLLQENSRGFSFGPSGLEGEGAEFLKQATASSQFVLVGESHNDEQTPVLAGALLKMLNREHGFDYLAVEQDPLAMEAVSGPLAGNLDAIVAHALRYPTHFEYVGDSDLRLLAAAGADPGLGRPAVWGLEQALGPARYLEELVALAPNETTRRMAVALLEEVRRVEVTRADYADFMHDDPTAERRFAGMARAFRSPAGSRADILLTGLRRSAEIFGYNRRAGAGEWTALFNNTEREAEFKRNFMRHYRAAAGDRLPRVLFKFGSAHMYRGRSPFLGYTLGNFAHEFAISNGMEAYGILVLAGSSNWSRIEEWMKPLVPEERPQGPVLVDLRALRPYQNLFRREVAEGERWRFRDLINGYDAIVVLPEGRSAARDLTGLPPL